LAARLQNKDEIARADGTPAEDTRLLDRYPQQGTHNVAANVSIWLRQFRPAFQRQFVSPPEADIELIDLLRAADERRECSAPPESPAPRSRDERRTPR
jgi:hypothetical protein